MRPSSNTKPKSDAAATNGITDTASRASTPAQRRKKPKPDGRKTTRLESKPSEEVLLVPGELHR